MLIYRSAVDHAYTRGYRDGYQAGEANAQATDEQFADLVAERTIARYLCGEQIQAEIRATLNALRAQKARRLGGDQ